MGSAAGTGVARLLAGALCVAFATAAGGAGAAFARQASAPIERTPEQVIQAQLAAFNAGDVDALAANVAEDFVYFAVDSDYSDPQLRGRLAFRRSMETYFASVPGARAEIEAIFPAGPYVAARERAYWLADGVEVSQASIAVYEVRGGLIHRVWYYPAVD